MLDRSGLKNIQIRIGLSQIGLRGAELRPFLCWKRRSLPPLPTGFCINSPKEPTHPPVGTARLTLHKKNRLQVVVEDTRVYDL
jgi:hypothetical protein